jgi:hypothetical protein
MFTRQIILLNYFENTVMINMHRERYISLDQKDIINHDYYTSDFLVFDKEKHV